MLRIALYTTHWQKTGLPQNAWATHGRKMSLGSRRQWFCSSDLRQKLSL